MKSLIENFPSHLEEALQIGSKANLQASTNPVANVLICGLGGSGISGTIVSQLKANEINVPVTVNKDYDIPAFVSSKTLVIICSYSGNTEETLSALDRCMEKNAEIACVTSGGKLKELARENDFNIITIPGGMPPRGAFGFAFPQLFFLLGTYGIIKSDFKNEIAEAAEMLKQKQHHIKVEAEALAEKLFEKTPVIYSENLFEGVAIRFRQQINENAKMLCWHHVLPEMNHNELVGWRIENKKLAVVLLRNESDYTRTQKRMEISKEIFGKYTETIIEVHSEGKNRMEEALYHIHLGDWTSYFLSVLRGVDTTEVKVIDYLKDELAKVK